MHHIVVDAWSRQVLLRELALHYEAFAAGRPAPLPDPPIQYLDYVAWLRQRLRGDVLEGLIAYWRDRLAGAPPLLDLATDRPRPARQSYQGATLGDLPGRARRRLEGLGHRQGATLFMTLLAAFKALLARYGGGEDVVVGTPFAGRNLVELEDLIGFFINVLPLRTDLSGDPSFSELLGRVRETTLGAPRTRKCRSQPWSGP